MLYKIKKRRRARGKGRAELVLPKPGPRILGLVENCPSSLGRFLSKKSPHSKGILRAGPPCLRAKLSGLVLMLLSTIWWKGLI